MFVNELKKNLIHKLCKLRNLLIDRDDFTWSRYHKIYEGEMIEGEKHFTFKLSDNDFLVEGRNLRIKRLPKPLHPNYELLYKIIFSLRPASIFEVGCGRGDHLSNLKKIFFKANLKKTKFSGSDLLENQIKKLYERNPELKKFAKIFVHDITTSPLPKMEELIYTQTVIMHLQKKNNHLDALRNIFQSSKKFVVLMENWERHNFYEDIKKISKEENFPWKRVYFYKVDSGVQISMVLSKVKIESNYLNYEELGDNKELLKYLKKKGSS